MTRLKGVLTVTVIQATEMPKTDMFGFRSADPYVIISTFPNLGPQELWAKSLDATNDKVQRTQIGEPTPIWHETFKFTLESEIEELYLHLFDQDSGRQDEELGSCTLPLHGKDFSKEWIIDDWAEVKNGKAVGAKIHVLVHFQSQSVLEHLSIKFNQQVADAKNKMYKNAVQNAFKMATGIEC